MTNEKKIRDKRRKSVAAVTLMLLLGTILTACGASTAATDVKETEVSTAAEEKDRQDVQKVKQTAEEAKEAVTEAIVEEAAVKEGPQTIEEWSKTVYKGEPQLTIWNNVTKEGFILERGQNHTLKEDEQVILCYDMLNSEVYSTETIEYETSLEFNSLIFEFPERPLYDSLFEIFVRTNDKEYAFSAFFTDEGAQPKPIEELSGRDWVKTLEYEEPKFVAWNDETGTREVIDNGGEYTMQNGDVIGIYYPTGHFVFNASPVDFSGGQTLLEKVSIMEYILPSESQVINLEVEVLNLEEELDTYNFVITTP